MKTIKYYLGKDLQNVLILVMVKDAKQTQVLMPQLGGPFQRASQ